MAAMGSELSAGFRRERLAFLNQPIDVVDLSHGNRGSDFAAERRLLIRVIFSRFPCNVKLFFVFSKQVKANEWKFQSGSQSFIVGDPGSTVLKIWIASRGRLILIALHP
jgi:hypothetical protein